MQQVTHSPEVRKIVVVIPEDIYKRLLLFFEGDENRLTCWWHARNPLLGGVTPADMMRLGREVKLRAWINTALDEGARCG